MTEKSLLYYWYVIYSRKWVVILITLAAIGTAVVFSKIIPPVYEAKAVFFVPKAPDTVTFYTPPGEKSARTFLTPQTNEEAQGPYIGILKSKTIAEMVHREFPAKSITALMKKDTDYVLSNEYMLQVYVRDRDPVQAASIANAYVKYFNQIMSGYSNNPQSHTKKTIELELKANREALGKARKALSEFQEKNDTANLAEETRQLIALKTSFESDLEKSEISLRGVMKRIASTEEELGKEENLLKDSDVTVMSPLLLKLKDQLVETESKISELKVELKEAHPDMRSLREKNATIQKNIKDEVERIIKSQIKAPDSFFEILRRQLINLYIERERLNASIKADRETISHIGLRLDRIPAIQARYASLSEKVERYKKLIDTLETNLQEAEAQSRRNMQVAVMVEKATPPGSPSFPKLWLNAVVAMLAGLAGSIFFCFLLDYLDNTRERRLLVLLRALRASEKTDG